MKAGERLTEEGLVTRIVEPKTAVEKKQIAMEIQNLADKTTVSRKKLLASLEAEVPRDADAVCQTIRNYKDYQNSG